MESQVSTTKSLRVVESILCRGNGQKDALTRGMTLRFALSDGITSLFEVYDGEDSFGTIEITEDDLKRHIRKGELVEISPSATIEGSCENCGTAAVAQDPPDEWRCGVCGSHAFVPTNDF